MLIPSRMQRHKAQLCRWGAGGQAANHPITIQELRGHLDILVMQNKYH